MLDKVPSNAELRRILSHMDAKGRSLFLVLASSRMRISEALKLKVEDVDLAADPPKINVNGEYTKTGNPRVAFITSEAKESPEEWLKIRENELQTAVKRSRYGKKAEDKRIWPFEANTAYYIWRNAIWPEAALQNASNTMMALKGSRFTHTCLKCFSEREWLLLSQLTL